MAPLSEETVQEVVAEAAEVELTPEQKKAKIEELMALGKREHMASNHDEAAKNFGKAAELAAEVYGELAAESFEPNFRYGRVMVEVGAVENDMFHNALLNIKKKEEEMEEESKGDEADDKDGNESMTEEEREEVREMVADALADNVEALEKNGEETADKKEEEAKEDVKVEEKAEGTKEEKKTDDVVVEKEPIAEAATEDKKEEEAGEEEKTEEEGGEQMETEESPEEEKEDIEDEEEDGEDEEEEEVTSSQLAWETLEVASRIADKQYEETKLDEWKRKKADVLVQLAQCSVNDEKYDVALEDLGKARDLLGEIESAKGDRLFAEIYFHEGRANRLRGDYVASTEAYTQAVAAMEKTLAMVKAASGDPPTDEQKEEIDELEEIIKDFKERVEDSKASEATKKAVAEMAEKEKSQQKPSILTTSNANSDASANDISSLVRKKRAHDESEVEGAAKKSKSEEVKEKGEENAAV